MISFLSRHLQKILVLILLITVAFTVSFLYKNFYNTLIGAEEILVLQRQVSPVYFKEAKWNEVMLELDEKANIPHLQGNINDPFRF